MYSPMRNSKFDQQNGRFFFANLEAEWFGGYWGLFLKQFTTQNNFWQLLRSCFSPWHSRFVLFWRSYQSFYEDLKKNNVSFIWKVLKRLLMIFMSVHHKEVNESHGEDPSPKPQNPKTPKTKKDLKVSKLILFLQNEWDTGYRWKQWNIGIAWR